MDTSHLLYASDLTDAEWTLLEPLLPPESPVGCLRLHSLRLILNAIFYQLRNGGAWRFLPQIASLEDHLPLFQKVARGRDAGAPAYRAA